MHLYSVVFNAVWDSTTPPCIRVPSDRTSSLRALCRGGGAGLGPSREPLGEELPPEGRPAEKLVAAVPRSGWAYTALMHSASRSRSFPSRNILLRVISVSPTQTQSSTDSAFEHKASEMLGRL